MKQTIIIGAGIAGLAAAVRLAAAGHSVDVYETNDGPGGKLSQFTLGDYRFDFGPSLFTMPQYVDELFQLAGEDPADHFEYHRLPDVCHYWWNDGTTFVAPGDTDRLADAAAETFGVPRSRVADFMANAAKKYELTGRTFLEKSLHKAGTWLDWQVAGAMLRVPQFDLFTSMHAVHERDLQHPKLVQLFDRFATYNGSNPYKAPGLLSMIPHFEHHFGAYLPKGGMFDISRSIYELGKRLGVRFHFGQRVEEILREGDKVVGVRLSPTPSPQAGEDARFARNKEKVAARPDLEHRVSQSEHRVAQSSSSNIQQDISSNNASDVSSLLRTAEGISEANGAGGPPKEDAERTVLASTVVCNMDVFLAYDKLLPGAKRPERTLRQQKSTSAVIFYWGIKREFPELGVHNIFFSDDYANEFARLEAGELSDDVTIYVNVSSKLVTEDAPSGSENWFVMVNAPADTGQDWDEVVGRLRSRVLSSLQKRLTLGAPSPNDAAPAAAPLESLIEEERIVTPPDIERLTGSHQGALYGTSSNNTMAAFLRHPNFSNRIDGLFFLGGSVHPGGGVPLCLLSAKITADLIAPTA